MIQGQRYLVVCEDAAKTAALGLIQVICGSAGVLTLVEAHITQITKSTNEMLEAHIRVGGTDGTGTAFTPIALDPAFAASNFTAKEDITVDGTGGNVYVPQGFSILTGWHYTPLPESRITVGPSDVLAIELDTAPAASMTFNAWAVFEEVGQ
jgi:hypothetical protein